MPATIAPEQHLLHLVLRLALRRARYTGDHRRHGHGEREVQTSETLIEVAMIQVLLARLGTAAGK